ncbi:Maltooligosyl trehalose synthase [Caulifigura coniformis]|uniref:Maltooligosyl trehalose synthase n=1 Tax=Caulifigura coniformis TaxID=2527983 RepID=A0A517SAG5_9PLAN|nr:malto-oligosyltrehalose synthase [Caulifigura coniformis]QDT53121.1 Maltooligosyl trehalose synthase [Caulifigura coniformis]
MTLEPTKGDNARSEAELIDAVVLKVRERLGRQDRILATYRLQFTGANFRFSQARVIADYLAKLGVSHVYSSPVLKSGAGSTHGYDVVDHTRLNDELGTDEEYAEYVQALKTNGLGQILDIVPNHMSVAADANRWWRDVLANGPASAYAHYFDIDWRPVKRELRNRVLLPVLGELYGKMLEAGQLPIVFDNGRFYVQVYERRLPLEIRTWVQVLEPGIDALTEKLGAESLPLLELQSILRGLQYLPSCEETLPEKIEERRREQVVLQARLQRVVEESPEIRLFIEENVATINGDPGKPESFDLLDRLLESQVYRLVLWKAGSDELNYRRFFDVTELAAVCTEHLDVFDATHRLPFEMLLRGDVNGFRIDHVDGLFDPTEYLWRLQWTLLRLIVRRQFEQAEAGDSESLARLEHAVLLRLRGDLGGPDPAGLFGLSTESRGEDHGAGPHSTKAKPLFVVVEKILGADEPLPPHWPVEGTTGYDFLNHLNGLFVDAEGLHKIERSWMRYIDQEEDLRDIIYHTKRLILSAAMQSEVALLAHRLDRLSNRHRITRDYTLQSIRSAIREIIASFAVYRSYIRRGVVSERDRRVVQLAAAQARRRNPAVDESVIQFVRDVLLLEQPPVLDERGIEERDFFIGRFQQVSSPVMAKGVEDTAFYRFVPLVSLEEVGGEPAHAVQSVSEFHRQNVARRQEWPNTMLATSTHDTKRSEDVRARINVLSEIPGEWQKAVSRWSRVNKKFHRDVDGQPAPSRNDEWLFYQSLLGAWPVTPPGEEELAALVDRLQRYMQKATREAKLNTSWISPNAAYDDAVQAFVAEVLDSSNARFLGDFAAFHESVIDSGLYNSASQVALKLAAPGIPDVYQGQELWDFSLVDPDNRRPVDYELRRQLLGEVQATSGDGTARLALCRALARGPRDPRLKLLITTTLLTLRSRQPDIFLGGEYIPLAVEGEFAEHVIAFARRARQSPGQSLVVIAPRLIHRLRGTEQRPPCGREFWGETRVVVGDALPVEIVNQFTGARTTVTNGRIPVAEALEDFPVAALTAATLPWQ